MEKIIIFLLIILPKLVSLSFGQSATEIIDKYIQKIGKDVYNLTSYKATEYSTSNLGVENEIKTIYCEKKPFFSRSDIFMNGTTKIIAFDGKYYWMQDEREKPRPMDGILTTKFKEVAFPFAGSLLIGLFLSSDSVSFSTKFLSEININKKDYFEIEYKRKNLVCYLYFSVDEYLIEFQSSERLTQNLEKHQYRLIKDYRTVGGLIIAFCNEYWQNGNIVSKSKIENIEFNIDLPDSLFSYPNDK